MDPPYGHPSRHHRRDDDDNDYFAGGDGPPSGFPSRPPPPGPPFGHPPPGPPFDHPPPPFFGGGDGFRPPPPPFDPFPSPPQDSGYGNYPPRRRPDESEAEGLSDYPPPSSVQHVSHETEQHHSHRPHMPSIFHHHSSDEQPDSAPVVNVGGGGGGEIASYFSNKPTMKIYCKAEPGYAVAIRNDKVIMARYNPNDETQQWYKDEKFSTRVKDGEGFPCFSLVNKATGQAIKHSVGASHPVQLVPYTPNQLDSSVLWSMGKDLGDGYRTVRMINNTGLNLDAFHGDKKSGGVHDGTQIVLWQWNKGDNQRWILAPIHCKFQNSLLHNERV